MKSRVMNILKKVGAGVLAMTLIVGGCMLPAKEADAATVTGVTSNIEYVPVKFSVCKTYIGVEPNIVPEYTELSDKSDSFGYLFAGWYKGDSDASANKIPNNDTSIADDTIVYAKFVPAYVMSVKCQNWSTTTANSVSTNIRLISSLDSNMYSQFGFRVNKWTANEDGSFTSAWGGYKEKAVSKIFKGGIDIYSDSDSYTTCETSDVFGEKSTYAASITLQGVKKEDFATTYSIQPYWVTFDGTKVYGLARYAHVEDGLNGYINVPVNLKDTDGVAAGVVKVDCSSLPDGYTFDKAECGIQFPEMSCHDNKNVVKIAANIADLTANASSNDIFVNLRFKPGDAKTTRTFDGTFYHFTMSEIDFVTNTEEAPKEYTVWDIQY